MILKRKYHARTEYILSTNETKMEEELIHKGHLKGLKHRCKVAKLKRRVPGKHKSKVMEKYHYKSNIL